MVGARSLAPKARIFLGSPKIPRVPRKILVGLTQNSIEPLVQESEIGYVRPTSDGYDSLQNGQNMRL